MQESNITPWMQQVQVARHAYFNSLQVSADALLPEALMRSWDRCRSFGLQAHGSQLGGEDFSEQQLLLALERNHKLLLHAQGVMSHLFEQIRHTNNVVVLADANGLLLHSLGDKGFAERAAQVALQPGAIWAETVRGTNAVGTALAQAGAVEVRGAEHFFEMHSVLTCSAAPLTDAHGNVIGVLDISGDYRSYQSHTLGLVRMAVKMIERRLFASEFAHHIVLAMHPNAHDLGSPCEALIALNEDGRVIGMDDTAIALLRLRRDGVGRYQWNSLFDCPMYSLLGRLQSSHDEYASFNTHNGQLMYGQLRNLPSFAPRTVERAGFVDKRAAHKTASIVAPNKPAIVQTLDDMHWGDARVKLAVERAKRMLGREIPLLILGESGAGKEVFARAYHQSGALRDMPFVAINTAAIPENLIESELFGYQGGAFTGAKKEGALGKIQQANGGTLFLDEIGDMPLALQARLLRVLQERTVTPLGSNRAIPIKISLVCATHRKLADEVAAGRFREDLYYRINGMVLTLPPLRERSDLPQLIARMIEMECAISSRPLVKLSAEVMDLFKSSNWPGNLRQLHNVIRVAIALLNEQEQEIQLIHLPDDMVDTSPLPTDAAPNETDLPLQDVYLQLVEQTFHKYRGNVSEAARKLGISRNTLYRKLGKLGKQKS